MDEVLWFDDLADSEIAQRMEHRGEWTFEAAMNVVHQYRIGNRVARVELIRQLGEER